uniref:Uncharacterized protein n=2 Tax=Ditylum brightwellii TaxID=49249 RepID=A0A7S4R946_9STRA
MMGNPLYTDEIGKMCFNPAKNWQLGWYGDKYVEVDPLLNSLSLHTLVGIGEFNEQQQQPVVVKIETGTPKDYFVGFNRAVGPNAQNDEADNEVTIVQVEGGEGHHYAQSYLKAHLLTGESYTIDNFANTGQPLTIKATYINLSTSPGTASIQILYGSDLHECESSDECSDDGIYCNGVEMCDTSASFPGACVSSGDPCQLGSKCSETTQSCTACDEVTLELTTDNYAGETSWDIKNNFGTIIDSGNNYGIGTHTETISNLQEGAYTFTIYDAFGDGICCSYGEGSYKVMSCGKTLAQGSSFGSSESTEFTIESSSTPLPTANPTNQPTNAPTSQPTNTPTSQPTNAPTNPPTAGPTNQPSNAPTSQPTNAPTNHPTNAPTAQPTNTLTNPPTVTLTNPPTTTPTIQPTNAPITPPTAAPTSQPNTTPNSQPTAAY